MIKLEEWVNIISLHRQGLSIKAIARRLGISRNTVRAALRREGPPAYQRTATSSKLDPYKDYLVARLTEFPELSAVALFEEIVALGYPGGLSIVKDFTRPYRVRRKEPVVRFETAPGLQAQADWSELGRHQLGGELTAVHLFVMVLGYSRIMYAKATTSANVDTFLTCHVAAFESFGGMPAEILYDNAKVVVLSRARDRIRFNPAFLDFAGRYGFAPRLCRPYRAKTKGKVERTIGYVKDRFLVGRSFAGLDDLNEQLAYWIESKANQRVHATTGERPCDRLKREGLVPFDQAMPWKRPLPPNIRPSQPRFKFVEPEVETRPLSVYEEVCQWT